jgi:hypothetical protein
MMFILKCSTRYGNTNVYNWMQSEGSLEFEKFPATEVDWFWLIEIRYNNDVSSLH